MTNLSATSLVSERLRGTDQVLDCAVANATVSASDQPRRHDVVK
jgi:hypothetical protein